MSVLVSALRFRNRFFPGYAGKLAHGYESHRQGPRWQREERAFQRLYERVKPATVLDCPVGTGRWLPKYVGAGASAVGVDLSKHMLAEAQKKAVPGSTIKLLDGDALDPNFLPSIGRFDLIVCTRFVHWLPPKDLARLIENFGTTGSRSLLIEAKVEAATSAKTNRPDRPIWKRVKARLHRNTVNHVHDEDDFLGLLKTRGWTLAAKEPVIEGGDFRTYLYLFDRDSA